MVSTIASLIRDNGNAILALSTATKPDGGKFLHKDILLALGLPTSAAHVREVSKFLNKQGIRRRAHYTRHRDAPDGGLLPGITDDMKVAMQPHPAQLTVTSVDDVCMAIGLLEQRIALLREAVDNFKDVLGLTPGRINDEIGSM